MSHQHLNSVPSYPFHAEMSLLLTKAVFLCFLANAASPNLTWQSCPHPPFLQLAISTAGTPWRHMQFGFHNHSPARPFTMYISCRQPVYTISKVLSLVTAAEMLTQRALDVVQVVSGTCTLPKSANAYKSIMAGTHSFLYLPWPEMAQSPTAVATSSLAFTFQLSSALYIPPNKH